MTANSQMNAPSAGLIRSLRGNPWAVLAVLSAGFFMILLELTIVNIAIPSMLGQLHASIDEILWVINGYALPLAALLITAGRLGDLRGPPTLFAAGVAVFTLASAACGLSASPAMLIAFRVVQGIGAALLVPQTLTILTTTFPPQRRGAAMGVWGSVGGAAAIAGPTLGGLLVTTVGWRWIFLVNVPVGAVVTAMSLVLIPGVRPGGRRRLGLPGVLLASMSLLAISYGLVEGPRYHWGTITGFVSIPLILGAGIVLLAVFLLIQARSQDREPLVPFALFRDRNYAVMTLVSAALAVAMIGLFLPFTIYLQSVLALPALRAGLVMAPMPAMMMLLAPVAGRLADRTGGKHLLLGGLILFAVGIGWLLAAAHAGSRWYDFLPAFLVAGTGMAGTFAPMTALATRTIQPQLAGAASGILNTSRQAGSVIGAAAVGALLQNRLAAALTRQATQRASTLPEPVRSQVTAGFRNAAIGGLPTGTGPAGNTPKPPPGTPPQLAHQLEQLGHTIFTHAFVAAMRPTMALPIAAIIAAAAACLAVKRTAQPHRSAAAKTTQAGTRPGHPPRRGHTPQAQRPARGSDPAQAA